MQTMTQDHEKATNYANDAYQFFESKAFKDYKAFADQNEQENKDSQPQFHYEIANANQIIQPSNHNVEMENVHEVNPSFGGENPVSVAAFMNDEASMQASQSAIEMQEDDKASE